MSVVKTVRGQSAATVRSGHFHIGVSEGRIDLVVELIDDLLGLFLGAPMPNQLLAS